MPQRWTRPTCAILLVAAWILDLITPQLFIAAILLNVPIALSSLALDSRFTRILVGIAIVADVSAGYVNGLAAHAHWDAVALGDRLIAALSFLLVGALTIATQRSAARAGELAARQDRANRERSVRRAVETIRASVNPQLIERAIVREAHASLGVDGVRLFVFSPSLDEPTTYTSDGDRGDVEVTRARPAAEILSMLHRIAEGGGGIVTLGSADALGRLVLETLGAPYAIAATLVEHATVFGILVLLRTHEPFEAHFDEGLAYYANQAAIALAQAALFVQLAERNEQLANANVALRERGDVIRDIVYALSHDLRTPLTAARMTMHQALDGAYGELPAAYREILHRTIASNEELQRLSETLLLVSRYESGEHSVRREIVPIEPLVRDVVAELEPLWRAKSIDVTICARAGTKEAVAAFADELELRRALVNLIANAVTWSPAHRAIEVRIEYDARVLRVAIDDNGYGVPEAERAHLFQRVRTTKSRHGAGSGLGLYLVRRIAESHQGTVSYAPRAQGGSTFELALPLAPAPASVTA